MLVSITWKYYTLFVLDTHYNWELRNVFILYRRVSTAPACCKLVGFFADPIK